MAYFTFWFLMQQPHYTLLNSSPLYGTNTVRARTHTSSVKWNTMYTTSHIHNISNYQNRSENNYAVTKSTVKLMLLHEVASLLTRCQMLWIYIPLLVECKEHWQETYVVMMIHYMSSNNNSFQTLTDVTVTVQSHTYMTHITSKRHVTFCETHVWI